MGRSIPAVLSVSIVMIAALVWASAALALDLKVGDVEIAGGETATVAVRASNTGGLGALQMRIGFDGNVVEVIDVTGGPHLANALVEFKANADNCTVALASSDAVTADGELLRLKIRRKPGTTAGSILRLEAVRAWASKDERSLDVSLAPGHVLPVSAAPEAEDWRWLIYAALGVFGIAIGFVAAQILHRYRRRAPTSFAPLSTSTPEGSPKFCFSCGTAVTPGANFCGNCGIKLH